GLGLAGFLQEHDRGHSRARLLVQGWWRHHLPPMDGRCVGLDVVGRRLRLGRRRSCRRSGRHRAHASQQPLAGAAGQCVGRVVPQHSHPGAAVHLVLRGAAPVPGVPRPARVRAGGLRARLLHLGADSGAGARRHPGVAARPALCRHGDGLHHRPDLPLRHPADGGAHHPAAADQRVDEPAEKFVGGLRRVDRRADHVRHAGAGRDVARHRDLPGR
ncbi:MAG: Glutamate Aspartate transport system permease protein GltJ, partial [uncultured Ramlibacter sp.]